MPSPPGDLLRGAVADLLDWVQIDHRATIDPVVSAAMAHYAFEARHPSHDGNGRIGRLLIVLHLHRHGILTEPTITVSPCLTDARDGSRDGTVAVAPTAAMFHLGCRLAHTGDIEAVSAVHPVGVSGHEVPGCALAAKVTTMTTMAPFGGTGKTGRRVLERALAAGHRVRALVRDPEKLSVRRDDRLTVVQGDVLDPAAVAETVAGSDVVLSLFGQVKGSPKNLQTEGTANIVAAMQRHGVSRIVTLSGGGLRAAGKDRPKIPDQVIRLLLKFMAGHVLADAEGHLEVLRESGLEWTVVRGPRLLETPGTGSYRVGWVGVNTSTQISRDDLADFLLTQVDDRTFTHQMPFVSN